MSDELVAGGMRPLHARTTWLGLTVLALTALPLAAHAQQGDLPPPPGLRLPGEADVMGARQTGYATPHGSTASRTGELQASATQPRPTPQARPALPQVPARLPQLPTPSTPPTLTTGSITPPAQAELPPPPPPAPEANQGLRLGSFILSGELTTGGVYSSRRDASGREAIGLRGAPDLRLRSNWSRHELAFTARGEFIAWSRGNHEAQGSLGAALRLDARRDTRLRLAVDYGVDDAEAIGTERQHEVDATLTLERERYRASVALTAGVLRHFERGNAQDYTQPHASLRGRLRTSPALAIYGEVGGDARLFDEKRDTSGASRNSLGGHVEAGVELLRGPIWEGRIGLRLEGRRYEAAGNDDFIGVGLNGNLIWRPTPRTEARLEAAFSLQDDAAGRVRQQTVALSLRQQLRRDVEARAHLAAENNDVESGTDTLTLRASASLAWQIWRRLWVVADYGWEKNLRRGAVDTPAEHRFGLGLRQTF